MFFLNKKLNKAIYLCTVIISNNLLFIGAEMNITTSANALQVRTEPLKSGCPTSLRSNFFVQDSQDTFLAFQGNHVKFVPLLIYQKTQILQ